MDRKKIALIILILAAFLVVVFLFLRDKTESPQMEGVISTEQSKKENQRAEFLSGFGKTFIGKIRSIDGKELTIEDDESPLKQISNDKTGPTVVLKITEMSDIFYVESGKVKEKKVFSDLRVGDLVRVEYIDLKKEIVTIYASNGSVDIRSDKRNWISES